MNNKNQEFIPIPNYKVIDKLFEIEEETKLVIMDKCKERLRKSILEDIKFIKSLRKDDE